VLKKHQMQLISYYRNKNKCITIKIIINLKRSPNSIVHGNTVEEAAQYFKEETRLFCIRTHCIPYGKHSPLRLCETSLLMLCKAKAAVCSENQ